MAQLAPQHQVEKLEAAPWPLQLDGHLNSIKETFKLLSQELDVTRRERDEYKAQLDAQAKELDDLRKFRGARFENDEQTEFTATSTAVSDCRSPVDEVGQSVAEETDFKLYSDESAGSPLDASEVGKSKGFARNTESNSSVKRLLGMKQVYTLQEGCVNNVRFSPDGKYLATLCAEGVTKVYETETGNNVCVLFDWYLADKYTHARNAVDLELVTVCFSPDNRYLATGGMDCKIRIWEIGRKGIRNIFKGQGNMSSLWSLDFLSNGPFIASASGDSEVRVWNMRTGAPTIFQGFEDPIWNVRGSPDGRYIAAGSQNMVLIWNIRSRALVNCLLEHPGTVSGVRFTQDGMRLVTGSSEGTLKLWDISSLKLEEQRGFRGQQQGGIVNGIQCLRNFDDAGNVWSIALSRDGQWVLSVSYGGTYFWDMRNGKRQCIETSALLVAFSPLSDYLAVGTQDGRVLLYTY